MRGRAGFSSTDPEESLQVSDMSALLGAIGIPPQVTRYFLQEARSFFQEASCFFREAPGFSQEAWWLLARGKEASCKNPSGFSRETRLLLARDPGLLARTPGAFRKNPWGFSQEPRGLLARDSGLLARESVASCKRVGASRTSLKNYGFDARRLSASSSQPRRSASIGMLDVNHEEMGKALDIGVEALQR